jgi:hypothetical protein
VKKNLLSYLLCSHKFHEIENYFSFEVVKKKNLGQFSKNYITFYPKIVTKLSKTWVRDPGSGKTPFRIPDPGIKKAPDPGSGSATLTYIVRPARMRSSVPLLEPGPPRFFWWYENNE